MNNVDYLSLVLSVLGSIAAVIAIVMTIQQRNAKKKQ